VLVGQVGAMPQRNEAGVRFRFDIEAATLDGAAVAVPRRVLLGWYGGAAVAADGRRWSCSVSRPTCAPGSAGR
jgi:competence protein ComEC